MSDKKTPSMYERNLALALLELTFKLPRRPEASSDAAPNHKTPRLIQLGLFIQRYFDNLSAFADIKDYAADLSFEESQVLVRELLPSMVSEVSLVSHLMQFSVTYTFNRNQTN